MTLWVNCLQQDVKKTLVTPLLMQPATVSDTLLIFVNSNKTSGDTLQRDIRRILGKPIIVLARQAQPTHD